jgi:hypothetical protein
VIRRVSADRTIERDPAVGDAGHLHAEELERPQARDVIHIRGDPERRGIAAVALHAVGTRRQFRGSEIEQIGVPDNVVARPTTGVGHEISGSAGVDNLVVLVDHAERLVDAGSG